MKNVLAQKIQELFEQHDGDIQVAFTENFILNDLMSNNHSQIDKQKDTQDQAVVTICVYGTDIKVFEYEYHPDDKNATLVTIYKDVNAYLASDEYKLELEQYK